MPQKPFNVGDKVIINNRDQRRPDKRIPFYKGEWWDTMEVTIPGEMFSKIKGPVAHHPEMVKEFCIPNCFLKLADQQQPATEKKTI